MDSRRFNLGRGTPKGKYRELTTIERQVARRAIKRIAHRVGGIDKLSSLMGCKHPLQAKLWCYRSVPLSRVVALELLARKLGLGYTRATFRPDIYPVEAPRDVRLPGVSGTIDYYD